MSALCRTPTPQDRSRANTIFQFWDDADANDVGAVVKMIEELHLPENAVCLISGTFVQARLFVEAKVIAKIDMIDPHPDLSQGLHALDAGVAYAQDQVLG